VWKWSVVVHFGTILSNWAWSWTPSLNDCHLRFPRGHVPLASSPLWLHQWIYVAGFHVASLFSVPGDGVCPLYIAGSSQSAAAVVLAADAEVTECDAWSPAGATPRRLQIEPQTNDAQLLTELKSANCCWGWTIIVCLCEWSALLRALLADMTETALFIIFSCPMLVADRLDSSSRETSTLQHSVSLCIVKSFSSSCKFSCSRPYNTAVCQFGQRSKIGLFFCFPTFLINSLKLTGMFSNKNILKSDDYVECFSNILVQSGLT